MGPQPSSRPALAFVLVCALLGVSAGCTSSATVEVTAISTVAHSPLPRNTGPLSTAAVGEHPTSACPYISVDDAAGIVGYRLDRITTLVQAGRVVGCRFYALQHPTAQCDQSCVDHERLPPADVPGIEILATRYRTALDAHNAFVRTAESGIDVQQVHIASGNTGLCYRTTVWTADHGTDWACAFSRGATAVVIRTVVTDPAYTVAELARTVAPRF